MTTLRARRRGEPLLALAAILSAWVAVRTAIWVRWPAAEAQPAARFAAGASHTAAVPTAALALGDPFRDMAAEPAASAMFPRGPERFQGQVSPSNHGVQVGVPVQPPAAVAPVSPGLAGGHALLWLSAVSHLPLPPLLRDAARIAPGAPPGVTAARSAGATPRRWSADAWAFVRPSGGSAGHGPALGTYGASQVGAVVRYRLTAASRHRPTAYVRASAALNGSGEREFAAGLSLRPIPSVPVSLAGEGRVTRLGGGTAIRPAVIAVTEVAPVTLPAGVRAEFYLQGGYVGGEAATAFVDGHLRLDREVATFGRIELRAGAGAWGGAQQGAQRLDLGPTASFGLSQGHAAARVGVDWRFRVAGHSAPQSGPAVTVSAGF